MGAQQSSGRDAPGGEAVKRCYYEVLGVEPHANDDEYGFRLLNPQI